MLADAAEKPSKERECVCQGYIWGLRGRKGCCVANYTVSGYRGVWQVLGSQSVNVGLARPVSSGDLWRLLAGEPSGSSVAHEHRQQKWGYLGLGQILSQAWSTEPLRNKYSGPPACFAWTKHEICRKQGGGQTQKSSSILWWGLSTLASHRRKGDTVSLGEFTLGTIILAFIYQKTRHHTLELASRLTKTSDLMID